MFKKSALSLLALVILSACGKQNSAPSSSATTEQTNLVGVYELEDAPGNFIVIEPGYFPGVGNGQSASVGLLVNRGPKLAWKFVYSHPGPEHRLSGNRLTGVQSSVLKTLGVTSQGAGTRVNSEQVSNVDLKRLILLLNEVSALQKRLLAHKIQTVILGESNTFLEVSTEQIILAKRMHQQFAQVTQYVTSQNVEMLTWFTGEYRSIKNPVAISRDGSGRKRLGFYPQSDLYPDRTLSDFSFEK